LYSCFLQLGVGREEIKMCDKISDVMHWDKQKKIWE